MEGLLLEMGPQERQDSRREGVHYLIVTSFCFVLFFCLEAKSIDIEVTHRDVTVEDMGVEKTLKEKNVE